MFSNHLAVAGLTTALTALVAGSTWAAPQYMSSVQGMQVGPDVPSTYSDDSNGYQDHSVSSGVTKTNFTVGASASSANGGTVSSDIQLAPIDEYAAPDHALTAISDAGATYLFSIAPKNGNADVDPIQVAIQAAGSISWNNSGSAEALFRLTNYNSYYSIVDEDIARNDNGANTYIEGSDGFSVDSAFTLYTNTIYSVVLSADTYADARGFDHDSYGEEYASADPTFTLVGPDASQYSIVGVPSSAPEPASWALLIAGLGLAGAGLRRRRRRYLGWPHGGLPSRLRIAAAWSLGVSIGRQMA